MFWTVTGYLGFNGRRRTVRLHGSIGHCSGPLSVRQEVALIPQSIQMISGYGEHEIDLLLRRARVVTTADGDWQAFASHPLQMSEVGTRAERALAPGIKIAPPPLGVAENCGREWAAGDLRLRV